MFFYFLQSYIRFHFGWRMAKRSGFGQPTYLSKDYIYYKENLHFPHYIRKHVLNSEVFLDPTSVSMFHGTVELVEKLVHDTIETGVVVRCVEKYSWRSLTIEKNFKDPIGTDRENKPVKICRVIVNHLGFILPDKLKLSDVEIKTAFPVSRGEFETGANEIFTQNHFST